MPPPNTLLSVGKCRGLVLTWGARLSLLDSFFFSSTSAQPKSKPPCIKRFKTATLSRKEIRICALNFLRLYLLPPTGIDNQVAENDVIKTQIVEVIKIINVTQEFLLACLHKTTKAYKSTAVTLIIEI